MKEFDFSQRLKRFPPYLFAEIDRQKEALRKEGIEFIDLSIGDPDIYAPCEVAAVLCEAAKVKSNQKYALDQGSLSLRKEISSWFKKRFKVDLDHNSEILPLIGSKEGLVHFPLAYVDRGDYMIVPSPGYPGYRSAAFFAGAEVYEMPLLEENRWLPDLEEIPLKVRNKAKLIYLNYPNNPTTVLAGLEFLKQAVEFCSKYGIILAYDNAYSEIYFDKIPHSVLEVPGAKEVALEFHSLSKTYCMTGFRVGWACGCASLLKGLLKVKANIDSGIFGAVQKAAVWALAKEDEFINDLRETFKVRRDIFVEELKTQGFCDIYSDSTFYVWVKIPHEYKASIDYAQYLLKNKRIVATPGLGFGKYGEGFIRFALTLDKSKLKGLSLR